MRPLLTREQIEEAFARLDAELGRLGERAELFLVRGAVMCLVHRARPSTKDVDGWFSNPQVVRAAAASVAADLGLPEDWLNDGAKGFIPAGAGMDVWRTLDHLTISYADAPTLLAMKCAAARGAEDSRDIQTLAAAGPDPAPDRGAVPVNPVECLAQARLLGDDYQLAINALVDEFRRAPFTLKAALVEPALRQGGSLEALIAAVVSYLCHEAGLPPPTWVDGVTSPAPMFVLPARSFAMRVRLMLESPPPFRNRQIYVPDNYLSRA